MLQNKVSAARPTFVRLIFRRYSYIWDLHIHRIPVHWDKRLWRGHFRLDNKPLYTKDILPMNFLHRTCIHICRSSNHIPDKLKLFSVYYATGKYTENSNVCSCIWDLHIYGIPGRWVNDSGATITVRIIGLFKRRISCPRIFSVVFVSIFAASRIIYRMG